MSRNSITFGALLIILGLVGYFATGRESWTALIPCIFGTGLLVLGWIAQNPQWRKHAMHAAAALALLGLGGAMPGLIKAVKWIGGMTPEHPAAVISQCIMAGLMLLFLILCIRSFKAARMTAH